MVIDARQRALEKLSYIFYLKRIQRRQQGYSQQDWKRAEKLLDYLTHRTGLFERIMK